MKKILIISLLFLSGCTVPNTSKGLKIFRAEYSEEDSLTIYSASEGGLEESVYIIKFLDKTGKFSVGDTIMIVKKP